MKKNLNLFGIAMLATQVGAYADLTLNFDDLPEGPVATYNDVEFNGWEVVTNDFGQPSPPNFITDTGGSGAGFDFPAGFTSLEFFAGAYGSFTVEVFSGLGGTGNELGSVSIPYSGGSFYAASVPFSGTGLSAVVTGVQTFPSLLSTILLSVPLLEYRQSPKCRVCL